MTRIKSIIFTSSDYEGCMNLNVLERFLILKAAKRYSGNRERMADSVGLSDRSIYRKIIQQGLETILSSRSDITREIIRIEKEYPLLFVEVF